jgi:hypothetical protein
MFFLQIAYTVGRSRDGTGVLVFEQDFYNLRDFIQSGQESFLQP